MFFSIQLQPLDKQKMRELASQARAAEARRVQEQFNSYPPADNIYFRDPVKVRFFLIILYPLQIS